MTTPPQSRVIERTQVSDEGFCPLGWRSRVPHVRDGFIVANVGIGTFIEAPAHLHPAETSKAETSKVEVKH